MYKIFMHLGCTADLQMVHKIVNIGEIRRNAIIQLFLDVPFNAIAKGCGYVHIRLESIEKLQFMLVFIFEKNVQSQAYLKLFHFSCHSQ